MKQIFVPLCFLVLASLLGAATLQFDTPQITYRDGYAVVNLPGAASFGQPGDPRVPAVPYTWLVPWGEEATGVSVERGEPVYIALDAPLMPVQQQWPLSQPQKMTFTQPATAAYAAQRSPAADYAALKTGLWRGYHLASMVVFPIVYLPQEQALLFYPQLTVNVQTQAAAGASTADALLRNDSATLSRLARMTDNAQAAYTYPQPAQTRTRDLFDYVIITDEDYVEDFQPLVDYKNSLGIVTQIETLQDIYANYLGATNSEKIRNYIIDAYQTNGITYVLLAGDDELIPHRGLIVDLGAGYSDTDVASDLYYTGLDGDWNTDGDNNWGEWSEIDFYSDVVGGRAPIDSSTEAQHFVNKQLMYQQTPVVADLTKDLLLGEDLGWTSWGSDYMEEIRLGGNYNGYATAGIPNNIEVTTLYDTYSYSWPANTLYDLLNAGTNLVGHLGHCNVLYNFKFYTSSVTTANFTNNGTNHNFYIINTQGCYCNSFDNRDDTHAVGNEDCIAEQMTVLANGPVCYVGNTRYGWGDGSGTDGSSQHLQREFYDAIYGEDISVIGQTHNDSRDDFVPYLSPNTTDLWAFFECTLLGDPSLDIWSDTPQQVTLNAPDILVIGSTSLSVSATSSDVDVQGMRVAAMFNGQLLGSALLNAGGSATIEFAGIETPGDLTVTLSGHNIYDTSATVQVISPNAAYIVPGAVTLQDGGDDLPAWNETVNVCVEARNVGTQASEQLTGTLTSSCPYLQIVTPTVSFGVVDGQGTAVPDSNFVFTTVMNIPEDTLADFTLTFQSGDETWDYSFRWTLCSPKVTLSGSIWNELVGNGNGVPEPGETLAPLFGYMNESEVSLDTLTVYLSCSNPYVTISPASLTFHNVASGQTALLDDFTVNILEDVTPLSTLNFYLHLDTDRGYSADCVLNVTMEALYNDFEDGITSDWTHDIVSAGCNDDWHHSSQSNHTQGGTWSWKCGANGAGEYSSNLYAALVSPTFTVPENASLSFWHWMEAEISGSYPGYAYDGGLMEISTDGGAEWTQIAPEGGYPYLSRGDTSPVAAETPLWSGDIDWTQVFFDLSDYQNQDVTLRFVFISDQGDQFTGWYIDDVRVTFERPLTAPVFIDAQLEGNNAVLTWDSPACAVDYYVLKRNGEVIADPLYSGTYSDDLNGMPLGTYAYTVAASRNGVLSAYSDPADIEFVSVHGGEAHAATTALRGNYPNPFNPETTIRWSVATPQQVSLKVYNVRGRLVRTLESGQVAAGAHQTVWRGDDDNGRQVSTGLYFVRMQAGGKSYTNKMLLLK